jgi:hypothetical protein
MRKRRSKIYRPVENQAIGRLEKEKTGSSLGGNPVSAVKKPDLLCVNLAQVQFCDMCEFGICIRGLHA